MKKPSAPIVIVVAMERHSRLIGKDNQLLWHVPEDLKRFKKLTIGHPVIMGRKTFESIIKILGKPLPDRTNIVMTRNTDYSHPNGDVKIATSLTEAFSIAESESPEEIHIGGGSELYKMCLPYTDRLHITFFDDPTKTGDSYFPEFENEFTVTKEHPPQKHEGINYQWVDFEHK